MRALAIPPTPKNAAAVIPALHGNALVIVAGDSSIQMYASSGKQADHHERRERRQPRTATARAASSEEPVLLAQHRVDHTAAVGGDHVDHSRSRSAPSNPLAAKICRTSSRSPSGHLVDVPLLHAPDALPCSCRSARAPR